MFYGDLGSFLRIRIAIGTREPLPLGIKVRKLLGEHEVLPIKIENLALFCFKYERLGHNGFNCSLGPTFNPRVVDNQKRRYSISLKGTTPKSRWPSFSNTSVSMHSITREMLSPEAPHACKSI